MAYARFLLAAAGYMLELVQKKKQFDLFLPRTTGATILPHLWE